MYTMLLWKKYKFLLIIMVLVEELEFYMIRLVEMLLESLLRCYWRACLLLYHELENLLVWITMLRDSLLGAWTYREQVRNHVTGSWLYRNKSINWGLRRILMFSVLSDQRQLHSLCLMSLWYVFFLLNYWLLLF